MNSKIFIATNAYGDYQKFNNYNQVLDFGEKYAGYQFYAVEKSAFNGLYKWAKSACIANAIKFAFNRLHDERKTQAI